MELIGKYFPEISKESEVWKRLAAMEAIYAEWNERINVISRKDMGHFYERHVLHSLAIAKHFQFTALDRVLDIGTGGGFPGIPLAVLFPKTPFILVDSRKKKCEVTDEVAHALGLDNVHVVLDRVENLQGTYTHFTSRAVAPMTKLMAWCKHLKAKDNSSRFIFLKGGDLNSEISDFQQLYPKLGVRQRELSLDFEEDFFSTKKLLWTSSK